MLLLLELKNTAQGNGNAARVTGKEPGPRVHCSSTALWKLALLFLPNIPPFPVFLLSPSLGYCLSAYSLNMLRDSSLAGISKKLPV